MSIGAGTFFFFLLLLLRLSALLFTSLFRNDTILLPLRKAFNMRRKIWVEGGEGKGLERKKKNEKRKTEQKFKRRMLVKFE